MTAIPTEYHCISCNARISSTDKYCPSCGADLAKVGRAISKTFTETIGFSDLFSSITVHNPKQVLKNCLKDKKWFEGIVLSATYFEYYGKKRLEELLKNKISPQRVNWLNLDALTILTFGLGIISQSTYCKIIEVKDKRNDLVHEPWTILELKDHEAQNLLEKGIECLDAIYC